MTPAAPTLLELQHAVRRDLLGEAPGATSTWVVEDGIDPQARLTIYHNTAAGTLAKALRLAFPCVEALVGAAFFEWAAILFAEARPPRSAWLDEYGEDFPEFLAELPQAASLPYLPDVARLDWLANTVLHAPDAPALDAAALAQIHESQLADTSFIPHPAARLLEAGSPVDRIWEAVLTRNDDALAALDIADDPVWLLVRRGTHAVEIERLGELQWRFVRALFAGHPLQAALDDAPVPDADRLLARLLVAGCFRARGNPPPSLPLEQEARQ